MTFWCIFRSPLMLGGNLPENRPFESELFNNVEVLAVDQQGEDPHLLHEKDGDLVWYSHVPNSKDLYVAMFNLNEKAGDVSFSFADLGIKGKAAVRDLWKKQDLGSFSKGYHQTINKHGAALVRVSVR